MYGVFSEILGTKMYVRICKASEIEEGELYRFDVSEKPLLVTRLGEKHFVTDSICTHEEADLSLGILNNEVLTCPLHRARFKIESGEVVSGPDDSEPESIPRLRTYQTKVENDELLADL